MEKFAPFVDLGEVIVPDDYDHTSGIKKFCRQNRKKFWYFNGAITDANFSHPTRILSPREKYQVRAFTQIVPGATSSEERLAFLKSQGTVLTGVQGAHLVFEQKRDQLPKGFWYASFDEKERLWKDSDGCHGVPFLITLARGDFDLDLGCFERYRGNVYAFLSFSDAG